VFRLIHGEGDQLPGLIVDYYAGCAVMQAHSVGMFLAQAEIIAAMRKVMGDSLVSVFDKSEGTLPFKADIDPHNGYVWGEGSPAVVLENGLKFRVNWETGQKTGFFVDQRDNRFLVEKYSKNRRVLNMFGYTGGFSVYALRGGASHVDTVDVSEKAIKLTDENVEINFGNDAPHTSYAVDAFDYMKTMEQKYDLIILDPPAFAKHMNVLDKALQAYKRLNQRAIEKIEPGGILFTFSCSQVVSKLDFRKSVFAAAANAKRNVRIIHQLDQPSDHPVNIFHPESEYLKGLVLHIE
jgi:23S rRNA (cytosine1962-C5)-methyltransferase